MPFALVSSLRKQSLFGLHFVVAFYCNVKLFVLAEAPDIFLQRTLIKMGVISIIDFCSPDSCFLGVTLGIEWLMHAASFGTLWSESFITYFCVSF